MILIGSTETLAPNLQDCKD